MFSSLKIGLVLLMMAGAGGGFLYVKKLQKDNEILKVNQAKLETAVEESSAVIEQQTKDLGQIRETLKEVEAQKAKLQKDKDALSNRLGKHDIGNLAENKPGLVEKIINKASDSATRCLEIASGSPLTEEEINGTPNRECPGFWPDDTVSE
tara:strand:+ start:32398 stop:32850 length:453 start_codon:yes stop_codon:yes gene_type:complete